MENDPTLNYESHAGPNLKGIPQHIGNYRVLGVLGQGGMGTVYLAEQKQPIQRKVAIKVIRTGMENAVVLARFQLERTALSRMNHPHIAAVYDAGTTEDGFPFFVMEHAEGEAITSHCDNHQCSLSQRVELFIKVCEAVAHAHRRMVIHRDLKPSNILVTMRDGKAIPKIIDFGVARFMETEREDHGLTHVGLPVGTPAYLAPEQIEGSPDDVDTRVDVYSLGVVLYELLCGARPFEDSSNVHQMFIRILSQDPPTPSTRLSVTVTDAKKQAAKHRAIEEKMLQRKLKGDLDWIVMMAIARNRDLRYLGVKQLADDLDRYLKNHPVHAKPPSNSYRFFKFVRRHRLAVSAVTCMLLALIVGIVGTTSALMQARQARHEAEAAEQTAQVTVTYLRDILSSADPTQDGRHVKVADMLERASQMISVDLEGRPEIAATLRQTIGWTYLELGIYDRAETQLMQALALNQKVLGENHPETLQTQNAIGRLLYKQGHYVDAEAIHSKVYHMQEQLLGESSPATMWSCYNLAKALDKQGKWDDAERLYRLNVAIRTKVLGANHPHTLISKSSLGLLLSASGRYREAQTLLFTNIRALRKTLGEEHPNTLNAMANLITVENRVGDYAAAYELSCKVKILQTKVFGEQHPETLESSFQQAFALAKLGRAEEAVTINRELLKVRQETMGADHTLTRKSLLELAGNYCVLGRHKLALTLYEEAFRNNELGYLGSEDEKVGYVAAFGSCLLHENRLKTALTRLQQAQVLLGSKVNEFPGLLTNLAFASEGLGNLDSAADYRAMIKKHP